MIAQELRAYTRSCVHVLAELSPEAARASRLERLEGLAAVAMTMAAGPALRLDLRQALFIQAARFRQVRDTLAAGGRLSRDLVDDLLLATAELDARIEVPTLSTVGRRHVLEALARLGLSDATHPRLHALARTLHPLLGPGR